MAWAKRNIGWLATAGAMIAGLLSYGAMAGSLNERVNNCERKQTAIEARFGSVDTKLDEANRSLGRIEGKLEVMINRGDIK